MTEAYLSSSSSIHCDVLFSTGFVIVSVMENANVIEDLTDYQGLEVAITKELNGKKRFVPMEERRDNGVLSKDVIMSLCHGNI